MAKKRKKPEDSNEPEKKPEPAKQPDDQKPAADTDRPVEPVPPIPIDAPGKGDKDAAVSDPMTQTPPPRNSPTDHEIEKPSFAEREQERRPYGEPKGETRANQPRPDPFGVHSVYWPDGFSVRFQESDSRRTVEIQFGSGRREDQPKAFEQIKPYLKEQGFRWNGECAWVLDLVPVRGPFAQREEAKQLNRDLRAHVEDVVFHKVVEMEETARGQIALAEETRQRIRRASEMNGRG